jgi:flavin-dependent dehydrogenase
MTWGLFVPVDEISCDVVVIGGGPAGSVAAMVLADLGRRVVLLEQRDFPRFHIGESMLPYSVGLFHKLGIHTEVEAQGYVHKHGAEFTNDDGEFRRVDFADQGAGRHPVTYQVERARFDDFLLGQAKRRGVDVRHQARVVDVVFDDNATATGVTYVLDNESRFLPARHVIDAGGRTSRIAKQLGLRRINEKLRNVAIFRHYDGFDETTGPAVAGDIQIGGHEDGWLWAIPIAADRISIGAVTPRDNLRNGDAETIFDDHLARIPRINQRLAGAKAQQDLKVETDYTYYADVVAGPAWTMVGDSGCFIDPMFSGGVYLAMTTGMRAAETAHQLIMVNDPAEAASLRDAYTAFYKTGYDAYMRLVYVFYQSRFNPTRMLRRAGLRLTGDQWFARLISGDFWSPVNPIGAHLRTLREWDTFAPFDFALQCPIYADADGGHGTPQPAVRAAAAPAGQDEGQRT